MTREEYLTQSRDKQIQIKKLEQELSELKKSYIDEHKQIKGEFPIKIHYVRSFEDFKEEGDAYIVGYKMFDYTYYVHGTDSFNKNHGLVYPYLLKAKKDGTMSRFEQNIPKWGVLTFWEIGKESEVHTIDFGI